ncbi:hypothetical protein GCM10019016_071720 [Streptomyces prasinosporus]|uniref:Uncharacterized protein n=1 Tax=Streptomyces prasinosporus TaxID=68256 RepID=A0ABP6U057_9ACTN
MVVHDEHVTPLEAGSPPHVDPPGRHQLVDDAPRRVGTDRRSRPPSGMVAQEAGEDALGQGDPLHHGVRDDRVRAEQARPQAFARPDGQPHEPLGALQRADPTERGGPAAARQGPAPAVGQFDDAVRGRCTQLRQAALDGRRGQAEIRGEGGDPRGAALRPQAERLDLDVDAERGIGVVRRLDEPHRHLHPATGHGRGDEAVAADLGMARSGR